ncbi:MAG TPA: hypothetical protein VG737_04615, partial [Cyclobacteriaceae bacterium]|nr:hypothetical protein [Cyclobacteriaceae bacterium]
MLLTFGVAFTVNGQDACSRAKDLVETINKQHLLPQTISDNFLERIFATFLAQMDPEQNYFTKKDSAWLRGKFLPAFNQAINGGGCTFFQEISAFFKQKLDGYRQFTDSALQLSPGYSSAQYASGLIGKSESFAPDYVSLKKRRMAWLKLRILSRAWRIADAKGVKLAPANFTATEKEARTKTLSRTRKSLERMLHAPDGFDAYVEILLMKSICQSYDPHTEYFTAAEMKSFQSALSTSEVSFGFELTES